jgi:hypothetical protein
VDSHIYSASGLTPDLAQDGPGGLGVCACVCVCGMCAVFIGVCVWVVCEWAYICSMSVWHVWIACAFVWYVGLCVQEGDCGVGIVGVWCVCGCV